MHISETCLYVNNKSVIYRSLFFPKYNSYLNIARQRHQEIKLAKEMVKEQRMKKLIIKANSVKWREWQNWFIEKATKVYKLFSNRKNKE